MTSGFHILEPLESKVDGRIPAIPPLGNDAALIAPSASTFAGTYKAILECCTQRSGHEGYMLVLKSLISPKDLCEKFLPLDPEMSLSTSLTPIKGGMMDSKSVWPY